MVTVHVVELMAQRAEIMENTAYKTICNQHTKHLKKTLQASYLIPQIYI